MTPAIRYFAGNCINGVLFRISAARLSLREDGYHKLRNVLDELPDEQQGQTLNLMRAAWKVTTPEEGEQRLEQLARFLERDHESAVRSPRGGMAEMFPLQRLKLPPSLYKCLATTNVIESPQGGVARRTGRGHALARSGDGRALGCLRLAVHRKTFPQD